VGHWQKAAGLPSEGTSTWVVPIDPRQGLGESPLARRIGELHLRQSTLEAVLTAIRDNARINLAVEWAELEKRGYKRTDRIDLNLHDVDVDTALKTLTLVAAANRLPLRYWIEADAVVLSTGDAQPPTVMAIYDITEQILSLQAHAQKVNGDELNRPVTPTAGSSSQAAAQVTSDEPAAEAIPKGLEESVLRETWKDNGGTLGSMRYFGGYLLVDQTPENQILVQRYLDKWRK
jgi:hypothetical protein